MCVITVYCVMSSMLFTSGNISAIINTINMFAGVEKVLVIEYTANPVILLPTHMHVLGVPCVELAQPLK